MKQFLLVLSVFLCSFCNAQSIEKFTIFSDNVKDSFAINIRIPARYTSSKFYNIVYVADGSLKFGSYILGKDKNWKATIPENCIIVTIAHFGDWHLKRQRDFIPSSAGGYSDKNFGKAENFYLLLKNELIPLINKKIINQNCRIFIGHSFSGLFCLYTLFKEDKLFDKHFAISPSVWANRGELLKIEEAYAKNNKFLYGNISIQAGGLEVFNKVLSSIKEFLNALEKRKYNNLFINYSTINNANHFSIIKPAVDKVFAMLKE